MGNHISRAPTIHILKKNDKQKIKEALESEYHRSRINDLVNDKDKETILMYAIKNQYDNDVIEWIIEAGADVNLYSKIDFYRVYPIEYAAKYNHECIDILIDNDAKIFGKNIKRSIIGIAINDNIDLLKVLLENDIVCEMVKSKYKNGFVHYLNYALECKKDKAVDMLLEYGVPCHIDNYDDCDSEYPPIITACKYNPKYVKVFIDKGADINVCKSVDYPLRTLYKKRNYDMFKYLIDNGADLTIKYYGYDILDEVIRSYKYFKLVINNYPYNNGYVKNIQKNGSNRLTRYILKYNPHRDREYKRILRYLLKHCDVNFKCSDGDTALMYECRKYHNIYTIQKLLDNGADINAINNDGESVLYSLIDGYIDNYINEYTGEFRFVSYDVLEFLIENGADVNYVYNWTDDERVKILLHPYINESYYTYTYEDYSEST